MATYTANKWRIQFSVAGIMLDSKPWSKASGGDIQVAAEVFQPGGMQPSFAVSSGMKTRQPMTLQRDWSDAMISQFIALDGAVGAQCTATLTPIKNVKANAGKPIVYTGVLNGVKRPDPDNTSGSVEYLEATMTCDEKISGGGA